MIEEHIKENKTTLELNDICHTYIIKKLKAYPATLNYKGFPKSICISINNEACHGIPKNRKLQKGDILNIDIAIIKNGYYGDTSKMFYVHEITNEAKKLLKISQECLYSAIKTIKHDANLNIIGETIENYANIHNVSIIKEYCGHGIGKSFHENPYILHYKNKKNKIKMKEGMIFTIEPIITNGTGLTKLAHDGWTVLTLDNALSAQWEHTILVTKMGYEILTLRTNEKIQ